MLGWIGDDNPDYFAEIAKSFRIPEVEVSFQNLRSNLSRDAPILILNIGIGWIGSKKGVSVLVVEHEYWYR